MEKINWETLVTSKYETLVVGGKEIHIVEEDDGSHFAWCMCSATGAIVRVPLTREQAFDILLARLSRRNIQEILPSVAKELREIFASGLTPAEFDLSVTGRMRRLKFYEKLGYAFLGR
jgi:hypothetical protein